MKTINLKIIADALDETFEGWNQFLNRETGEVISFPEDKGYYVGDDYDAEMDRLTNSELYVCLPDQYEIHEYGIMEDFARKSRKTELMTALRQKHPYRRFKDEIVYLGIDKLYYSFRENAYYEIAKEWCRKNEIAFFDSK